MMAENLEITTPVGSVKTDSANNVITLVTCIVVCVTAWTLWTHSVDAKDGAATVAAQLKADNAANAQAIKEQSKESVSALKDLTQATREQTCLMSQEKKDAGAADFCKRLTR